MKKTEEVDVNEIMEDLKYNTGVVPTQAILESVPNREQMTPLLLQILEESITFPDVLADDSYMAHVYAMYLLARFREKQAYPLIIDFFSTSDEVMLESAGDIVTEDLHRIFASVSQGDNVLIKRLVENDKANEYVRGAALEALLTQVVCGDATREEIMAYYTQLFRGGLEKEPSQVWNSLVDCSNELYPEEVITDIKQAYAAGFAKKSYIEFEYIEETMTGGKDAKLTETYSNQRYTLINDIIGDIKWWSCFNKPAEHGYSAQHKEHQQLMYFKQNPEASAGMQKIGRNEPCPCGSGKKYKKCCGR